MSFDDFDIFREALTKDDINTDDATQKPTVVVVDDDKVIRESLKLALGDAFDVVLCSSGDEGVKAINEKVQAVILDVKMEGKDGFDTYAEIKKQFEHLPIIFHSAYQDLKDPYDIINDYKPFGYVTKDGGLSSLVDSLNKAIDYYRTIRGNNVLVESLQQMNSSLENKVQESSRELEDTINQLLHSKKMASIGVLAAGVAHEINNPLGYIKSNLSSLNKYTADMISILEIYESFDPILNRDADTKSLLSRKKSGVEYEYLKCDALDLINETQEGVTRVKKIVQDLRNFSDVDESDLQETDIHMCIDSALRITDIEVKHKADIVKEYGVIPIVRCIPSQINQVIQNMLINASQAIEGKGLITIQTGMTKHEAWIKVIDNGVGIEKENLPHIFDPFFTTKPVGTGTGLGLSLCFRIIERHRGSIQVESEAGNGTTFIIRLPISGPEEQDA